MIRRFFSAALAIQAALVLVAAAWSMPAHAQVMTVAVTKLGDRDAQTLNPNDANPIGIAECNDATQISFRVSMIPSGTSQLDYWRGSACNKPRTESGRCDTTNTSCTNLSVGSTSLGGTTQQDINDIALSTLVDCSKDTFTTNNIFILAADATPECDDIMNNWGQLNITVDRQRPVAPVNVKGGNGKNSVSVSWDAIGEANLLEHRIYVAQDGCASNSVLQPGALPPDSLSPQQTANGTSTSASISGDAIGSIGSSATVGVVAVDRAKNPGLLGTSCVERVATSGFCDILDPINGCPNDCRIAPWRAAQHAWWPLAALGWLALQRRARRKAGKA